MSEHERGRSFVGCDCTLNGKPAKIVGRLNDFGTVRTDDGTAFEWSWPSIGRIMDKGGEFKS